MGVVIHTYAFKHVFFVTQNPQNFVETVLQVHAHYQELIRKVFSNDQQFVGALDKACAHVINYKDNRLTPCRSPELVRFFSPAQLSLCSN
jgi:putative heme degradation protein